MFCRRILSSITKTQQKMPLKKLQPIVFSALLAIVFAANHSQSAIPSVKLSRTTSISSPFCVNNSYPPSVFSNTTKALPWFVVNLDLPPEQRWIEISQIYSTRIHALVDWYRSTVLAHHPVLHFVVVHLVDLVAPHMLAPSIPQEYQDEMRGIAETTKIPFAQILLYNLFYELQTSFTIACTSIVARSSATHDGGTSVIHARNLDFGDASSQVDNSTNEWVMTEILRPLEINVEFRRLNQTIMRATHFAGYVGILTGVRQHAFSLTVNQRDDNRTRVDLLWWLLRGGAIRANAGHWVGFATRFALEQVDSFEAARVLLGSYQLITPVYWTLAGTKANEGCVITRAIKQAVDERCLSGGGQNATANPWFVLETNFDWWNVPGDDRRARALECMEDKNAEGRGAVSPAELFDVLSSKPVLNKMTLYTSLMSASQGTLESYSRVCVGDDC